VAFKPGGGKIADSFAQLDFTRTAYSRPVQQDPNNFSVSEADALMIMGHFIGVILCCQLFRDLTAYTKSL
jgi:hypothetical protein